MKFKSLVLLRSDPSQYFVNEVVVSIDHWVLAPRDVTTSQLNHLPSSHQEEAEGVVAAAPSFPWADDDRQGVKTQA